MSPMPAIIALVLLALLEEEDEDKVPPKTYEQIMAEARARGRRNEEKDAI